MKSLTQKGKRKLLIFAAVIAILLAAAVVFWQCTPLGYRMTVPYRGFTEVESNVYIDNGYSGNKEEVIEIVNAAKNRVSDFWGDIESNPMIIITDNQSTIARLGGDHDTLTLALFRVYSYVVASDEYLNVNVIAHELTHAELHTRIYKGKLLPRNLIPTWFDEGVALQNDYRDRYSDEAWIEITNDGSDIPSLEEMDTAEEFYAGDKEDRRCRYVISKYEVKSWMEKNGIDSLIELLDSINKGGDFYELYQSSQQ